MKIPKIQLYFCPVCKKATTVKVLGTPINREYCKKCGALTTKI